MALLTMMMMMMMMIKKASDIGRAGATIPMWSYLVLPSLHLISSVSGQTQTTQICVPEYSAKQAAAPMKALPWQIKSSFSSAFWKLTLTSKMATWQLTSAGWYVYSQGVWITEPLICKRYIFLEIGINHSIASKQLQSSRPFSKKPSSLIINPCTQRWCNIEQAMSFDNSTNVLYTNETMNVWHAFHVWREKESPNKLCL